MKRRYEVILDGADGVFAIDRLRGTTRYTQVPAIKDFELIYEGLRLVVPVVLSEELEAVTAYPMWRALKQLEFLHKVVFIVVPQRVVSFELARRTLEEFSQLVISTIGWQLLPLFVEDTSAVFSEDLFSAFLEALQMRWKNSTNVQIPECADALRATLLAPLVDATLRTEVAAMASKEYSSKDYARKRLASFVEYYADNSLLDVVASARKFSSQSIDGGELAARLSDALATKKPFSFIRVGEGEGCFLSHARYVADRIPSNEVFGVCAKDIYKVWFDRNIHEATADELNAIRGLFWQAIRAADVIGVPTPERVLFEQSHFVMDIASQGSSRGYVGVSEILCHMERAHQAGQLVGKLFTDCDIARPLYEWQDWNHSLATTLPRLLKRRQGVTLVTSHSHLAQAMQAMLYFQQVRTLEIPPERGRLKGESYLEGDHYHDYFDIICDALRRDARPVVLVAAGFLGKAYCAVAREAGSVAIDIGALADFWAGYIRRNSCFCTTTRW